MDCCNIWQDVDKFMKQHKLRYRERYGLLQLSTQKPTKVIE